MIKSFEARRTISSTINDIIQSAIASAKEFHELRGASISFSPEGVYTADVVPQVIHTAVVNMILNAAESQPRTRILVVLLESPDHNSLVIEVHDNGPGVPVNLRSRIFEPRYSTKPFNSGLGLLAVESAAHVHRGIVKAEDSPILGGACFKLAIANTPVLPIDGN